MSEEPQNGEQIIMGRRKLMIAGASLVVASMLAGVGRANAQAAETPPLKGPYRVRAYATTGAKSGLAPTPIQRRALGQGRIDRHRARRHWPFR